MLCLINSPHLRLKSLHQDGHQQIKEDVVAESHESDKVERRPGGGGGHAVVENHIPVLLRENLQNKRKRTETVKRKLAMEAKKKSVNGATKKDKVKKKK